MCDVSLSEFRSWLVASGASHRTITERIGAIRHLGRTAGGCPCHLSAQDVTRWVGSVPAAWSKVTYYGHAASWARFLTASGRDGSWLDGVPKPKARRGTPRPCSLTDLTAAYSIADDETKMMLALASLQGLRVSEVAKIRGEDVNADTLFVEGKGGSRAMLPTHPTVWAHAAMFPPRGWWFPGANPRRPVCRQTVWRRISDALQSVGCYAVPHQLRHFYGSTLLDTGANIRVVQRLLRHESLSSTQIYTWVHDGDCRTAIHALPALT